MPLNLQLGGVPVPGLPNTGGGIKIGGVSIGTLSGILKNAPVVGGIVNNLGSIAKVAGIHIDPKSPATHIKERIAMATPLMEAAKVGSDLAWEKLWTASGRPLPVRRVDDVAQQQDDKRTKKVNEFFGWPRVDQQLKAMLREVEQVRGALPQPTGNSTDAIVHTTVEAILQAGNLAAQSKGPLGITGDVLSLGDAPIGGGSALKPSDAPKYVPLGFLILAALYLVKGR